MEGCEFCPVQLRSVAWMDRNMRNRRGVCIQTDEKHAQLQRNACMGGRSAFTRRHSPGLMSGHAEISGLPGNGVVQGVPRNPHGVCDETRRSHTASQCGRYFVGVVPPGWKTSMAAHCSVQQSRNMASVYIYISTRLSGERKPGPTQHI